MSLGEFRRGRSHGRTVTGRDGVRRYVWRVDADPGKCVSYQIEETNGILHARVMPGPVSLALNMKLPE